MRELDAAQRSARIREREHRSLSGYDRRCRGRYFFLNLAVTERSMSIVTVHSGLVPAHEPSHLSNT